MILKIMSKILIQSTKMVNNNIKKIVPSQLSNKSKRVESHRNCSVYKRLEKDNQNNIIKKLRSHSNTKWSKINSKVGKAESFLLKSPKRDRKIMST